MEYVLDFINDRISQITQVLVILIAATIIYKIITSILNKAMIKGKTELDAKRYKTINSLLNNVVKYVIVIIALILIAQVFGADTRAFLAGFGVIGLIVGLALQETLRDILGGINIVLDNYFVLGDLVEFGNFRGTVIEFGLKSTKIKAETGEVLVIANRSVDRVINISQKQPVVNIEIPTAPESDIKVVRKALDSVIEAAKKLEDVNPEGTEYIGIERIEPQRVVYIIRIKCKRGCQFTMRRIVLEMIKEAYSKADLRLS